MIAFLLLVIATLGYLLVKQSRASIISLMVLMICQFMDHGEYRGDAYIYSHGEVLALIRDMAGRLLREKEAAFIDDRLHLVEVTDRETREIIGHETTFFDIHSTKAKQFGFRMDMLALFWERRMRSSSLRQRLLEQGCD